MQDFSNREINLNDRVFVSWGGKKHAIGRVSKFVGKKTIEINRIEKSTYSTTDKALCLVWRAEDAVILG